MYMIRCECPEGEIRMQSIKEALFNALMEYEGKPVECCLGSPPSITWPLKGREVTHEELSGVLETFPGSENLGGIVDGALSIQVLEVGEPQYPKLVEYGSC